MLRLALNKTPVPLCIARRYGTPLGSPTKGATKPKKSLYAKATTQVYNKIRPSVSDSVEVPYLDQDYIDDDKHQTLSHGETVALKIKIHKEQMTETRKRLGKEYGKYRSEYNQRTVAKFLNHKKAVMDYRAAKMKVSLENMAKNERRQDVTREEYDRMKREKNQSRLNREAVESSRRKDFLRRMADESATYITKETLEDHLERQLNPGRVLVRTFFGPQVMGINDEVAAEVLQVASQQAELDKLQDLRRKLGPDDPKIKDIPYNLYELFPFYTDMMYPYVKILKADLGNRLMRANVVNEVSQDMKRLGFLDASGVPVFESEAKRRVEEKRERTQVHHYVHLLSQAIDKGDVYAAAVIDEWMQNDPEGYFLYENAQTRGTSPFLGVLEDPYSYLYGGPALAQIDTWKDLGDPEEFIINHEAIVESHFERKYDQPYSTFNHVSDRTMFKRYNNREPLENYKDYLDNTPYGNDMSNILKFDDDGEIITNFEEEGDEDPTLESNQFITQEKLGRLYKPIEVTEEEIQNLKQQVQDDDDEYNPSSSSSKNQSMDEYRHRDEFDGEYYGDYENDQGVNPNTYQSPFKEQRYDDNDGYLDDTYQSPHQQQEDQQEEQEVTQKSDDVDVVDNDGFLNDTYQPPLQEEQPKEQEEPALAQKSDVGVDSYDDIYKLNLDDDDDDLPSSHKLDLDSANDTGYNFLGSDADDDTHNLKGLYEGREELDRYIPLHVLRELYIRNNIDCVNPDTYENMRHAYDDIHALETTDDDDDGVSGNDSGDSEEEEFDRVNENEDMERGVFGGEGEDVNDDGEQSQVDGEQNDNDQEQDDDNDQNDNDQDLNDYDQFDQYESEFNQIDHDNIITDPLSDHTVKSSSGGDPKVAAMINAVKEMTMNLDPTEFSKLKTFIDKKSSIMDLTTAMKNDPELQDQYARYSEKLRHTALEFIKKE